MKLRHDFVTNSSSTSYICEICNESKGCYNNSPFELGMVDCGNHIVCVDHIEEHFNLDFIKQEIIRDFEESTKSKISDKLRQKIESCSNLEEILDIYDLEIEYIPASICPICTFKEISNFDLESYKNYLLGKSNKELKEEIKSKYSSFGEFIKEVYKKV